ncbi:GNAT family N-acetyltransferase [Providencia sp. PROV197]|uniref:GNAT family N-acetyltransferase n=1 Tax=Providencia sp. PROV197 TaxID=2949898 RepID=UPI002349EB0E|nr:GNAT family N-acetyltransferase [Providencia sp. PROV197]
MYQYRQLLATDATAFYQLLHHAYAEIKHLGIRFDAATADLAAMTQHLNNHAVYGMFEDGILIASVTLRYPWSKQPGPFGLPHIGWFATAPTHRGQQLGKKILTWFEDNILSQQLRAPAYSLGTAQSHPWLVDYYQSLGFQTVEKRDLGKGHITIFMRKIIDQQRYTQWLAISNQPEKTR